MRREAQFRLLLIEDNIADVVLISEIFDSCAEIACETQHARRLSEGIELLATGHFDVVLLDLGLPDSRGLETFVKLRKVRSDLPVLVLTGLDDHAIGREAVHLGAQDYLIKKELSGPLLAHALRYAMERHRVLNDLRASEERFNLAMSGAAAGLWDWNPRTDAVYFSPRFKRLLGFDVNEMPDVAGFLRERVYVEDRPARTAALEAHLASRVPFEIEYRIMVKDGTYRWFQARGQALWDEQGRPYRMVGWIQDIHARKEAESELRTSRENLRRLALRLQTVRETERTRISREIHDEIGQMLTGMKMDLRFLGRKLDKLEASELTVAMERKLGEMEILMDQSIRTVQRIAIEMRPTVLDSLGLAEAIRDEVRRFQARSGLRVELAIAPGMGRPSAGVGTACFRILQELLANIARHAQATTVEIQMRDEDGALVLVVRDDGVGIPADARTRPTSLGLLSISERATALSGEAVIDKGAEGGTIARIRLPLVSPS